MEYVMDPNLTINRINDKLLTGDCNNLRDEKNLIQLEVMVSEKDLGILIGKNGRTISSIRNIVQASATLNGGKKVKINVDSY